MARRQSKALQFELRERLAQESARLMIEHGIVDYGLAKRKAAENLSVAGRGGLPSNSQIEACLAERQRIFEPDRHAARLWQLRHVALSVMRQLAGFEPRLAGPVLSGTATANSRIELHVFASGSRRPSRAAIASVSTPRSSPSRAGANGRHAASARAQRWWRSMAT
jgi:hypothetical protein